MMTHKPLRMAPAAMIQGDALRRLQETRPKSRLGTQANVPHPPGRPENLENGMGATEGGAGTIMQQGPAA